MHILRSLYSFYRPSYILVLVHALKDRQYRFGAYTNWFWYTNDFVDGSKKPSRLSAEDRMLIGLSILTALTELAAGVLFVIAGLDDEVFGGVFFGLGLILATPITLGVLLPLLYVAAQAIGMLHPKMLGKRFICSILEWQARRLRRKHKFKVVAVAGSMGKTSTKLAIAQTLEAPDLHVRYQEGNYNDRITVPLVLFGQPLPNLYNVFAWIRTFQSNGRIIRGQYPYDVAVLELGTDRPGEIEKFSYLKPDIAVVTGIAPEHMEYFGTLDAVADEELAIAGFSKKTLLNTDDTAEEYAKRCKHIGYGLINSQAGYYAEGTNEDLYGQQLTCKIDGRTLVEAHVQFLGAQGRKIILAAAAVADMLEVPHTKMMRALEDLEPFSGRMQILPGVKNSTLIDDAYNATPAAVEAALQVLINAKASQRIAILGSMNELGDYAIEAHKTVGASLDPDKVNLVITIGRQAQDYLAPAARENGCEVETFLNPKAAGEFAKAKLKDGAVVLCKGSQNGVFAEEALKVLLARVEDQEKLVRQSRFWMKRKRSVLENNV